MEAERGAVLRHIPPPAPVRKARAAGGSSARPLAPRAPHAGRMPQKRVKPVCNPWMPRVAVCCVNWPSG